MAMAMPAGGWLRTRRLTVVAATLWACATPLFAQGVGQPGPRVVNPADEANCGRMEGYRIPASAIGLPTSGAAVTSASVVRAAPQAPRPPNTGGPGGGGGGQNAGTILPATPEYCKILGYIAPKDPRAERINFQINLPTAWNGKTMQIGGGGMNGSIPGSVVNSTQAGPAPIPPDAPYALARGFVVYGSDAGHQNVPGPGAKPPEWMQNDETLRNLLDNQLKKTHDVAMTLVKLRYGQTPRYSYFFGNSTGGREALLVAQRYPNDYDGVFAQVQVLPYTTQFLVDPWLRAQAQKGAGAIPAAKVATIAKEIRRQCDALDGIEDGWVSNYMACNAKFDPSIGKPDFSAIRCEGGVIDGGDVCLTDAQIASVNKIHGPIQLPFPLYKDFPVLPGWSTGEETANNWRQVGNNPVNGPESNNVNYFSKDRTTTIFTADLPKYAKAIQAFSLLADPMNPDLTAFQRHGGKLVMKTHTADYNVNPRWSYAYYDKVVEKMGKATVESFMRLYVGIGLTHGPRGVNPLTNEAAPDVADFITTMDDWVEKGKAPDFTQVLSAMDPDPPFAIRSTFPLCAYPRYPHYRGGDAKSAASYECRVSGG
jgi:Tannase and feruloyl esterase